MFKITSVKCLVSDNKSSNGSHNDPLDEMLILAILQKRSAFYNLQSAVICINVSDESMLGHRLALVLSVIPAVWHCSSAESICEEALCTSMEFGYKMTLYQIVSWSGSAFAYSSVLCGIYLDTYFL